MSSRIDVDRIATDLSRMRQRTSGRLTFLVALLLSIFSLAGLQSYRAGLTEGHLDMEVQKLREDLAQASDLASEAQQQRADLERKRAQMVTEYEQLATQMRLLAAENSDLKAKIIKLNSARRCP